MKKERKRWRRKVKKKEGADSLLNRMVYLRFTCRADKTSNLHLFLLLKLLTHAVSFAHSLVCSLPFGLEERFFSKTFLRLLVICCSEKSIVLFLFVVVVFPTPFSLFLCLQLLLGDYYSTKKKKKKKKKIEYIERKKASNSESNDGRIRNGLLHVDLRACVCVCVRVCVYFLLSFTIYSQHRKDFHYFIRLSNRNKMALDKVR
jgi:hypothetical protein